MHPLNPYLRAFFRSALPSQCQPVNHHVLLVPKTDVLLHAKDRETNTSYVDLAGTEEFLASHVLRVPSGGALLTAGGNGKDSGSIRESKSKAKQYSTLNGRTVVVKESYVYSNKGFKTLNQAQLLGDAIYYPDASDGQQWLIYYISRPLLGLYTPTPIVPAIISSEPSEERRNFLAEAAGNHAPNPASSSTRKEIKNFGELLTQFPMISRQVQSSMEKLIREFVSANDSTPPKRLSRSSSMSSQRSTPSIADSVASVKSSLSGTSTVHPTALELEPPEEALRASLETLISSAIDIFQSVDKQQLSLLGNNTELTGTTVERMIERYILEQIHDHSLFPKICALRKTEDMDLDYKIRKMSDIDIGQVGIPMEDGMSGRRQIAARLKKGVEKFKKTGVASSPQEMLEILLDTQMVITASDPSERDGTEDSMGAMQTQLTINADILVSMLLVVVIRSGVRHLHSRLLCMRYFIFTDEVEIGEQGYALATLEAVLAHLMGASGSLRKASKRNRSFWHAVRTGDIQALEVILQPQSQLDEDQVRATSPSVVDQDSSEDDEGTLVGDAQSGSDRPRTPQATSSNDFALVQGSLGHVFPFQKPPTPPPERTETKLKKHVSMASLPRSHSASSTYSTRSRSRTKSIDSDIGGERGGDMSPHVLAQTQDAGSNSALMMAVDAGRSDSLKFLLNMPAHFRISFILEDINDDGATLLSAAMQTGDRVITNLLIDYIETNASDAEFRKYAGIQDGKGRCFAHYLFHQPHLIQRFGKKVPWRLKDKNGQTPLFALCRSYDHEQYHTMVDAGLSFATALQGDGEPLHLDDHVDGKGNTLLHIINDVSLALRLLRRCDSDVNAANDKRFTPLMMGSKYGRIDLVRTLFGDPRVDMTLKDMRGLSAVELAKDDDVRNRIDDLVLLSTPAGTDGRITTVVRSLFVEDATIRFVMKSGAPNRNGSITVTTCRRSLSDFENLIKWLAVECPASWLPSHLNLPSPFLIPSRPSKAVLRDIQIRVDNFFRSLLTHGTFSTHELVWEFFLVPELDVEMLSERTRRKAETRMENVKDEYEPLLDAREVENFVAFARDQIRGVTQATKRVIRATNRQRMLYNDLSEAQSLNSTAASSLLFLPQSHITAFERHARTLIPTEASPLAGLYYGLLSVLSTGSAIQVATDRPAYLIGGMSQAQRAIDRSKASISRSSRWTPNIGLFEDARRAITLDAWDKAAKARNELESLGSELRYTQQTIATELALWQDDHVRSGRAMLRRLAKDSIVRERVKLEGMKRALREVRKQTS